MTNHEHFVKLKRKGTMKMARLNPLKRPLALYHGTYGDLVKEIYEMGRLEAKRTSETTQEFDDLILEFGDGSYNPKVVYLALEEVSTYGYDLTLTIHPDELNTHRLWVADFYLREEILCCHCDCFHSDEVLYESEMKRVVQAYLDSRMPYEQYLQEKFNQDKDYFPEFMYADDIELNRFQLHELSQFLNETEIEEWDDEGLS